MNSHSISNRQLDKYMGQLLDRCGASGSVQFFDGSCISDAEFLKAIRMLEATGEIECRYPLGGGSPYLIRILPEGRLHFYRKDQQRIGFWKGFFSGAAVGIIAAIIESLLNMLL